MSPAVLQSRPGRGQLGKRVADLDREVVERPSSGGVDFDEGEVVMGVAGGEEGHRAFAEVSAGDLAEAEHLVEVEGPAEVGHAEHEVSDLRDRDGHADLRVGRGPVPPGQR